MGRSMINYTPRMNDATNRLKIDSVVVLIVGLRQCSAFPLFFSTNNLNPFVFLCR